MRRPPSLTLRLTLLFAAAAVIVFLSFGWIIGRELENHFGSEDIKELNIIAEALEQTLGSTSFHDDMARIEQRLGDILIGHHSATLQITDAKGEMLFVSPGPDLSRVPRIDTNAPSTGIIKQWNDGKDNYRVLIKKIDENANSSRGPYTAVIAVATDYHLHFLTQFRYTLWLMVGCGIFIMGVMGWIAVRHGHRPLHDMVDQISQISTNKLNTRLAPETVPAELSELAHSFNQLMQRMEQSFNRLENYSADIAHELRTPITNMMTQTQVALSQSRSADEYREILYSNMEEFERMAQMIGDMLFLAKADNELTPINSEEIDLEREIKNLFDYYEAWAEESNISLLLKGQAHTQGDRLMLRRALSNLLSNAIRHTPAGREITVSLGQTKNHLEISVANPGTEIPTEHLARVFDRFYRIDPSRKRSGEGAGLGLAIVKSIVEAHGGSVSVSSDKSLTQFKVHLPVMTYIKYKAS